MNKDNLKKLLLAGIALVLVYGLAAGVPVSADDTRGPGLNEWGQVGMPAITPYTEAGVMQLAPDGTIFAAIYYEAGYDAYLASEHAITIEKDGTWDIMRSEDGGFNWEVTSLTGLSDDDPYDYADANSQTPVSIKVSPIWPADKRVYVATLNGDVYRLADAGSGRSIGLTPAISEGRLYDMDIWFDGTHHYIAVATDEDILVIVDGQMTSWTGMQLGNGTIDGNAVEVAFCPYFDESELIWAVAEDGTTGNLKLTSAVGAGNWGNTIAEVEFENAAGSPHGWTPFVDIAFGPHYTREYPELYVAVAEEYGSQAGNLYHVTGEFNNTDPGDTVATPVLPEDRSLGSVEVNGSTIITIESWTGTVLVSEDGGNIFNEAYRSPAAPYWGHVYMAPDFSQSGTIYAGVFDYYSYEGVSGIYRSTDGGHNWDGISYLDMQIEQIKDLAFKPASARQPALMLVERDSVDYIFYTPDAAAGNPRWLLKDSSASLSLDEISLLSWARIGGTVMLAGFDGEDWQVYRSTDDGNSFNFWRNVPEEVGTPADWVVVDRATINIVGEAFWATRPIGTHILTDTLDGVGVDGISIDRYGDVIAIGMAGGYVAVSTNNGSSWQAGRPYVDETPAQLEGDVLVALGPDDALYATSGSGSSTIVTIHANSNGLAATTLKDNLGEGSGAVAGGFTGIKVTPDNSLYAISTGNVFSPVSLAGAHMFRLLIGERDNSWDLKPIEGPAGLWATGGSNTLWTVAGGVEVHAFEDNLTVDVENVSAVEVRPIPSWTARSIRVSWNHLANAHTYQVYVDDGEDLIIGTSTVEEGLPAGTSLNTEVSGLKYGTTYSVTVRVLEGEPLQSRFSAPARVTTVWHILPPAPEVPAQGMQRSSLAPSFVWQPATGAVAYEFQLTTEPGFSFTELTVYVQAIKSTGYTYEARDLRYDTNYFWRVRSVAPDGSKSYWSPVQSFHTRLKPVEPPVFPEPAQQAPYATLTVTQPPAQTITVSVPPAAATLTQTVTDTPTPTIIMPERPVPAYIWVIVVIGVLLVGVVIFLIYRTSRIG